MSLQTIETMIMKMLCLIILFPSVSAGVDGYTYEEWLAMERLRSLSEYRQQKLDLGRRAKEERRRLIATRYSIKGLSDPCSDDKKTH